MERAAAELERRSRYLRTLIHQQKTSDNPKAESLEGAKGEEEGKATKESSLVVVKQRKQEEKLQRKKGYVGRGGEADPGDNNQGSLRVRAADMPPELQKRAFWCANQGEPLVVVKQPEEEKQQRKKGDVVRGGEVDPGEKNQGNLRVRAADMPLELQKRAFRCAHQMLAEMPKLDSKRLALSLKKEFDSSYGPAWHCIVGKSFGSYVTHSLGGFLYFSIDKVYILLFRTAVEPLEQ